MTQNYKQDLNFCLDLTDARGEAIGWPAFDWRAKFYTSTAKRSVTAMCVGGVAVNCFNDGGRIHVAVDKHGLAPGVLQCEFTALIPDSSHPDGSQAVVRVAPLDIELTVDAADIPADVSASLMLPAYVRDLEKNLDEIRKAIGCSLDEINARLEAILGREPGSPGGGSGGETAVRVAKENTTRILHRGIIPFGAKPGAVYQSLGKIKIQSSGNDRFLSLAPLANLSNFTIIEDGWCYVKDNAIYVPAYRPCLITYSNDEHDEGLIAMGDDGCFFFPREGGSALERITLKPPFLRSTSLSKELGFRAVIDWLCRYDPNCYVTENSGWLHLTGLQLQRLRRGRRTDNSEHGRPRARTYWKDVTSERPANGASEGEKDVRWSNLGCGVYRVRRITRTRKSEWIKFSYTAGRMKLI